MIANYSRNTEHGELNYWHQTKQGMQSHITMELHNKVLEHSEILYFTVLNDINILD